MKSIKKSLIALLLVLALAVSLAGCAKTPTPQDPVPDTPPTTPAEKIKLTVAGLAGPTGVGLVHLMEGAGADTIDYSFQIAASPDEVVGKFASGEVDIASVPTNLAAKLYKKLNGDVQMLAVNTAGVLYMIENGSAIQSVADLKGRTIYSTGEGANPEYVLRHILLKNGIDPDRDVTSEFLSDNTELITKLAAGKAEVAMVPEPAATTVLSKNADLRVALSMDDEWSAVEPDSDMFMGCIVAKKSFIESHPEAVAAFLEDYKASVDATADVDTTAALCEKYAIIPAAAIARGAIPRCNLLFLSGGEMQTRIAGYYQVLFEADPTSIGGAVPDDDFYYKGK